MISGIGEQDHAVRFLAGQDNEALVMEPSAFSGQLPGPEYESIVGCPQPRNALIRVEVQLIG